jgi:hypothetical protein
MFSPFNVRRDSGGSLPASSSNSSYIATDVCRPVCLGAGPHNLISLFDTYFLSCRCRAPSPISPLKRVSQLKVKLPLGGLHVKHAVQRGI